MKTLLQKALPILGVVLWVVLAGLGFAIASVWMFAPELDASTVRPVLQDWMLPPVELWAMFPTGRRASAKARAFAGFIEEQLSGDGLASSLLDLVRRLRSVA